MSQVLEVRDLCKEYPSFRLEHVSFALQKGKIMGFIGRNGAGKTTTLKSMLNLVHPSSGTITFFGMSFAEHESEIKQRIGYASGGINYYQHKKLKDIVNTTKTFYDSWEEERYRHFMEYFSLDEMKKPSELSEGMKVKFNITLALSHRAEILILDEPTSGLDPVSREDLLEVFMELASEDVAILFSTHITSDLEKCADCITYIKNGKILASKDTDAFVDTYRLVRVPDSMSAEQKQGIIGVNKSRTGSTALVYKEDMANYEGMECMVPGLEEIMSHIEHKQES